ncbi:MAG: RdgB/HAM1 family non-canonical purine NTP pyrophosphatase [Myxococcales bacterium]|nr:RdgB/HAM1 family non-canonical purine NTP pyrophosphatase [Myxococcales bacterium]
MRILVATSNSDKLREFREILRDTPHEVIGLDALGREIEEPVEDGETFEANARIKALAYARAAGLPCVAEDSGLEVDALGGAPGVYSARYAGVDGDRKTRDLRNNEKLLAAMEGVPDGERAARFVCALCYASPEGEILFETRGTFEGVIARAPAGENGFGYDPLLFVPELGKTSAELTSEEKHARSHRGEAVRAFARHLSEVSR